MLSPTSSRKLAQSSKSSKNHFLDLTCPVKKARLGLIDLRRAFSKKNLKKFGENFTKHLTKIIFAGMII